MWIGFGPINDMPTYKLRPNTRRSHNSTWTEQRERQLLLYVEDGVPIPDIAEKMGLSIGAIQGKLSRMESGYIPRIGPTPKEKFIDQLLKKKGIK